MNNLRTSKVTSVKRSKKASVCDIEVQDVHHYILADGTVSHNSMSMFSPGNVQAGGSGMIYSASIILEFM